MTMMSDERRSRYTSFYIDEETREMLEDLVVTSGKNRSQIVCSLIRAASEDRQKRLSALVRELAEIIGA